MFSWQAGCSGPCNSKLLYDKSQHTSITQESQLRYYKSLEQ
jgi:hypothetical protein